MNTFTSKELYMMNGGNKLYIHKDGFGDIYNATAAEEAEWADEYIKSTLLKIDKEVDTTVLSFAIESLRFHNYPLVNDLLISKIMDASPLQKIAFATALWTNVKYVESFKIILVQLIQYRNECLNQAFLALGQFHQNGEAREYLLSCIIGEDIELAFKAHNTLLMWAWSGLPLLRENGLLEQLNVESKNKDKYRSAVEQLKNILNVKI